LQRGRALILEKVNRFKYGNSQAPENQATTTTTESGYQGALTPQEVQAMKFPQPEVPTPTEAPTPPQEQATPVATTQETASTPPAQEQAAPVQETATVQTPIETPTQPAA